MPAQTLLFPTTQPPTVPKRKTRAVTEETLVTAQLLGGSMMTKRHSMRFAEAASVCLAHHRHGIDVTFTLKGSVRGTCPVRRLSVTEQMRAGWNDLERATEDGAYAIAFIVMKHKKNLHPVSQAKKKTGFDYWMGPPTAQLFQGTARLEVSGILDGSNASSNARLHKKIKQIKQSDATKLIAYAVVVDFGNLQVKSNERKVR